MSNFSFKTSSRFVIGVVPVTTFLSTRHQFPIKQKRRLTRRTISVRIVFCFLVLLVAGWQTCLAANKQNRVLMLTMMMREAPSTRTFENVFREVLNRELGDVDLYSEFIDVVRFQESGYQEALGDFLSRRYANQKLDLVVVDSGVAFEFVKKYQAQLFPGIPVVFLTISEPEGFPNSTGAFHLLDFKSSFELALKLQPGTREVFVVVGSGEFDKFYATRARPQLENFESRVKITYLEGLTISDLQTKLAHLPSDSIIYYLVFTSDPSGNRYNPSDALRLLSPSANAPIYTWYEWQNEEMVGGTLLSGMMLAEKLAEISVRVLKGEKPENIPVVEIQPRITTVDWRQLRRWQINEALVPPGTIVRFKEPTFWETYRWRIVGVISLCVLEAILIALLLMSWMRRRQAELRSRRFAALAEAERRHLDEVVSNVPGIVWESRLDANGKKKVDFVSDYVEKVFGYSADEWFSTPDFWLSIILEEDRERAAQCGEKVFATGRQQSVQFRCRRKDNHVVWVEEHLDVINDEQGHNIGLRGVTLNISERKKAEAFRDGQSQILERIAAQAPLHDVLNSLVLLVEAQFEGTLCSISLLDEDGRDVRHTFAPSLSLADLPAISGSLRADRDLATIHGLSASAATPILSHAGHVLGFLTLYYTKSRSDDGFEQQLIGTVTHIAGIAIERHRAEAAVQSLSGRLINAQEEERRRIARELHDDLNQGVALLAIQLEHCRLDPPESVQKMRERMEDLWKNARDLSGSIRALSHSLHPSILDSLGLAAATETFCQELKCAHDLEVEFVQHDVSLKLNKEIALCLYRVIQEALHNVVKHSHAKHARVDLSSDAQGISLTIVDSGAGFDVDSDHSRNGLGLISMRERLRLVNGQLSIQSEPLKGTTIKAYVPLDKPIGPVADPAFNQPLFVSTSGGGVMKRRTILLADYHTMLPDAFRKILEPEFEVVGVVADGHAVIAKAAELKPDVIVLDIAMPLLNGLDAGRRVKETLPATKLVYLTMSNNPKLAAEAFRLGASAFLLKTSAASELNKAIRSVLGGKRYVTAELEEPLEEAMLEPVLRNGSAPKLTNRQREVLQLLAEGRSMKEAAYILQIAERTVIYHKYHIMSEFQIKTNAELIQFALKQNLSAF